MAVKIVRIMWSFLLTMLSFGAVLAESVAPAPTVKAGVIDEEKAIKSHVLDSLDMLMFMSLLILVILTIWLFKHRRFRFVHETGLAIIYGLIVGAIITYTGKASQNSFYKCSTSPESNYTVNNPPDTVQLQIHSDPENRSILYTYNGLIQGREAGEPELEQKATFDPEVFFNVLLPPIIFNAGYQMKRKHFFRNFGAITTYALLGTAVSCFVVGAVMYGFTRVPGLMGVSFAFNDCLFFGAIISATDPVTVLAIFHDLNVDVDLYALVFGESVLNDAVAIVLAGTIQHYTSSKGGFDGMAVLRSLGSFLGVFFGAFALGSGIGVLTALLTKFTHIRDFPLLETSLFVLMSYASFLAAEAAGLTGIVAVLFCGICQAHYTYNNLSNESKVRTKQVFELLNFLMENFVFLYIGVSVFTFTRHKWEWWFILTSFIAIIVGRLCNIYPLSFLLNLGRSNKIRYNFQHMMMFSGLRGAIAFALAIRNTSNNEAGQVMFSTTLIIVIATVVMCGGFTTPMLQWLKIRVGVEEETELHSFEALRSSPSEALPPPVQAAPSGRLAEKAILVQKWYKIDAALVKPLLTHARPPLTETLPKCCMPLATLLTTQEQLSNRDVATRRRNEDSDTDLIIDDQDLSIGDPSALDPVSPGDQPTSASNRQKATNGGAQPQPSTDFEMNI